MTMAITPPTVPEPLVEKEPATGQLFLEVTPGNAHVFVDGYYVGTPDDVGATSRGVILEAGPHRIEINAPGYEPVNFDVMISPNRAITYRWVMKSPEPAPTPQRSVPAKPRTFYLIPGCYMGDVPPKDAKLPSTCDITRAITYSIP
jgi:hypothetical protein